MSQKRCENSHMTSAAIAEEMRCSLRQLAGQKMASDSVKSLIGRAARSAGLTYSRAYELWYGRARRIDAHELDGVRARLQAQRDEADRSRFREEIAEIHARLARLEGVDAGSAAPPPSR
jgi:hypothetical protein